MENTLAPTTLGQETKSILLLALPIMANGLLESSYGFITTFMVAHLGISELAINGVISLLFTTIMVIFWGILSSTSILISHQHGAKNIPAIRSILRDSLLLSFFLSLPVMFLLWFAPDIFLWFGLPQNIVKMGEKYLHVLTWSVPADFLGLVLMQFFTGMSRPILTFTFTLIYMPFLLLINYGLVFGKFHLHALGLQGIGWGALITYTFIALLMILYLFSRPQYRHFFHFQLSDKKHYIGELLRVGLPLGGMYSIEIGYFFMLAMMMGKVSAVALAANQVVMQYLWLTMNFIFSFGQALSIRIGWRIGRKETLWIRPITQIGQRVIFAFTLFVASIYWLLPHYLIAFDLGQKVNTHLQSLAIGFFLLTAIFQLTEGQRVTYFSILRGLKDTVFTLLNSIFTFWGVALITGTCFTFLVSGRNPNGLWWGLILSSILGSCILRWRIGQKIDAIKKDA